MTLKDWISIGIIMLVMLTAGLNMSEKSGPKLLAQKITSTVNMIGTIRSMANTFSTLNSTKDYNGIAMNTMATAGLMDVPVTGTGPTSTILAPYDTEMTLSIAPNSTSKKFIISITNSTNTDMDAVGLQQFEDNINTNLVAAGATVTGYTTTSADGEIQVEFSN